MKRLLVHVEGQTEEQFVNEIVTPHLGTCGFASVSARLLGSRHQRAYRGGVRPWAGVRREIERHLLGDSGVLAGLLVDYYGMPLDWPGRSEAPTRQHEERSRFVVHALRGDFPTEIRARVFPCVLMHEFESFVFADVDAAAQSWGLESLAAGLRAIRTAFPTAEHINDSPQTAPSKRLKHLLGNYEKPLMGALAVLEIGLERLRSECPAFAAWLMDLETEGRSAA